jgi:hypothetical protein
MASVKNCAANFAYTPDPSCFQYKNQDSPGCSNVDAVMNLTNQVNVPFDNFGYLQAKSQCASVFNPFRKTLPEWPPKFSKMYPTMDLTSESFPLQPKTALDMDINAWENTVANWPPAPIPLDATNVNAAVQPTAMVMATATRDPNVRYHLVPRAVQAQQAPPAQQAQQTRVPESERKSRLVRSKYNVGECIKSTSQKCLAQVVGIVLIVSILLLTLIAMVGK